MAIVTHQGQEYSCSVALKGDDYIHLLNEDGDMTVAFDGITDFSKFSITGGSWKTPTPENECYVAVVKDDGTMGKGGHRCSGVSPISHTHNSVLNTSSDYSGSMKGQFVDQSTVIGWEILGKYSNNDSTDVRLSLRVNKETGLICARVDSKAGAKYPDFYTTLNKPTASDVGIVYSASQPTGKTGMIWLKPV
jgi:hypothetical protein